MLAAVNMRRVFASNWKHRRLAMRMLMKMVVALIFYKKNITSIKVAFTIYQTPTKKVFKINQVDEINSLLKMSYSDC